MAADAQADAGADGDSTTRDPSVLDALDRSQGVFAAELAAVPTMATTLAASGAGTVDRTFVGGDPLLVGAAAERIVHVGSPDCANSPYGCPSRVPADHAAVPEARAPPVGVRPARRRRTPGSGLRHQPVSSRRGQSARAGPAQAWQPTHAAPVRGASPRDSV